MGGDHAKQEAATSLLRRDRRASSSQEALGHLIYRCPGSRNHKPTTRSQHRVRCQQQDAKLFLHQELSHFTAATVSSPVQSILPVSAARPVRGGRVWSYLTGTRLPVSTSGHLCCHQVRPWSETWHLGT